VANSLICGTEQLTYRGNQFQRFYVEHLKKICKFIKAQEEWGLLGFYAVCFLQEQHGVTSQKTPFFIVAAVKTSNLTY
jgi:hypothetical protein